MPDTANQGELWFRASRVLEACDIKVGVTAVPPGWRVTIRPRDNPDVQVTGNGAHLVEAMTEAIRRAENSGYTPVAPRL
jgi:hypothetical protein